MRVTSPELLNDADGDACMRTASEVSSPTLSRNLERRKLNPPMLVHWNRQVRQ